VVARSIAVARTFSLPLRPRRRQPRRSNVKKVFPTPQDAENAFYEALGRADLEAMMEVWSEDDEVMCVHPGGPRLYGFDQVRASWAQIFSGGGSLKVHIAQPVYMQSGMVAIHNVHEVITSGGSTRPAQPVVATNVYIRTGNGWRMIVHHASPAPSMPERPAEAPKTLH
jgi:ketosteroid isomerase-like protein